MLPLELLRNALTAWNPATCRTGDRPGEPGLGYAVWRFLRAWSWERERGVPGFGPDAAVLLRQALRWGGGPLRIGNVPAEGLAVLGKAGVELTAAGRLAAIPYVPDFLRDDCLDPEAGIDDPPRLVRPAERLAGERFLLELGRGSREGVPPRYTSWQSAVQKEAAWHALNTPPGGTCLVVLPTGTGKSLVFQLLAEASGGLTVVVVPTVALAIDQWQAAREILPGLNPLYYAAGDDPDGVIGALTKHSSRLLFTSPEACVSGRLRTVLQAFAEQGQLDNLVIDEVHIVDSWGAYFRVDFQMLSGLRKTWLEAPGARLRTLLLTATLTPRSRTDLAGLFPPKPGAGWWEVVSQRLRPEMTYFDRRFIDAAARNEAVHEALWHLPRPAILYVTERAEAEGWYRRLTEEKFRRIGCFHGDTRPSRRRELLDLWRADELDLMVATSAFGLGVDKPDVRAVVHACFPEDMNRYYQEVGRGGRDGYSALCLLLPTGKDEEVAFGLSPKLMTTELLKERWRAMWDPDARSPVPGTDNSVWLLNTAAVRQGMLGQRTGKENVLWNKRLLLQLQRAGALELRGVRYEYPTDAEEAPREFVEVEPKFNLTTARVAEVVEGPRREELSVAERGLKLVAEHLRSTQCVARLLAGLYGEETQLVCGGCRWCRREGVPPNDCPSLEWVSAPRGGEVPAVVSLVGGCPDPFGEEDVFCQAVRSCMERKHVRRFVVGGPHGKRITELIARTYDVLPTYLRRPYRVDSLCDTRVQALPGETVVVFHVGHTADGAFDLRGGKEHAHWFRVPVTVQELRTPLAARGVLDLAVWSRPEEWYRV